MKIDDVDLDILTLLSIEEETDVTTTFIAKKIFDIDSSDVDEVRKRTNYVRRRLENKLVPNDLVKKSSDGNSNKYRLSDKVSVIPEARIELNTADGIKSSELSKVVLIRYNGDVKVHGLIQDLK